MDPPGVRYQNVSAEDLVSVGGAVKGVPLRILRKMNAKEMLGNGSLEDVAQMMTKGQKEALMEGVSKAWNSFNNTSVC